MIAALLPRVGVETVQRAERPAPPALDVPAGGLTLQDLVDHYDRATAPEDKAFYRAMVERLGERL